MKKPLLDTSSAILLLKAGLFDILVDVYSISLTCAVLHELTGNDHYGADIFKKYWVAGKIGVVAMQLRSFPGLKARQPPNSLDPGELETIACFMAGGYDFIIIDDGKAARYCRRNKIPFINALLLPRLLYYGSTLSLDASNAALETLVCCGRYSDWVIKWAHHCKRESLLFAIP